jgi:pimeloyl-ACP methyl ester carboxylesterase
VEDVAPYFDHVVHLDFRAVPAHAARRPGEHSAEDLLAERARARLVVTGERDSFTPPAVTRAMAEAIPGAELELCAGARTLLRSSNMSASSAS